MANAKVWLVLLVVAGVIAGFSIFTVNERERAILFELGRIVRSDYPPGLYVKIPIVREVRKFDARIQTLDAAPELYLTSEKKNVKVDSFVKWRIRDVERFYTATGGSVRRASSRLQAIIQKDLKDAFGKRTIAEVVSGERAAMMRNITVRLDVAVADLGMEVVDVRVKRIDLPDDVSTSVFNRMSAERKEVAKKFRSRGEEQAKTIRARADREREVILAEANRDAQLIRGDGDALAADTYAQAYNQDPEFYAFYRSLGAYAKTFNSRSDILLLQPDAEFFRYFKDPKGRRAPGQ